MLIPVAPLPTQHCFTAFKHIGRLKLAIAEVGNMRLVPCVGHIDAEIWVFGLTAVDCHEV